MTNRVGLWIDRKQAVIVALDDTRASVTKLQSGAQHPGYRGAPRTKTGYGAQYGKGDDQVDQQYLQHLDKYYKQVVAHLRAATSVLIFGPGEAKSDLRKHLKRVKAHGRLVIMEPADKMTDRQILAKVRKHFQ